MKYPYRVWNTSPQEPPFSTLLSKVEKYHSFPNPAIPGGTSYNTVSLASGLKPLSPNLCAVRGHFNVRGKRYVETGREIRIQLPWGGPRFSELPLRRLAAWGAVAGLVLGVLPFVLGTLTSKHPLWFLVLAIFGSTTLLSAVSAVGSALLFRYAARQQLAAGAGVGQ